MTPTTDDVAGLVAELREYSTWGEFGPRANNGKLLNAAADLLESQAKALRENDAALRTVQNAAKTIAACQGTELEHLRQNASFDHKQRAEHESLIARDAMMTEALEAAETRALAAEARLKEAEKVIGPLAALKLWRDTYPDGPDIFGGGSLDRAFTPDQVRAARAFLNAGEK